MKGLRYPQNMAQKSQCEEDVVKIARKLDGAESFVTSRRDVVWSLRTIDWVNHCNYTLCTLQSYTILLYNTILAQHIENRSSRGQNHRVAKKRRKYRMMYVYWNIHHQTELSVRRVHSKIRHMLHTWLRTRLFNRVRTSEFIVIPKHARRSAWWEITAASGVETETLLCRGWHGPTLGMTRLGG